MTIEEIQILASKMQRRTKKKCATCGKDRMVSHILKVKEENRYVCVACVCRYYARKVKK